MVRWWINGLANKWLKVSLINKSISKHLMTLSEVYFYMVMILYVILSFLIMFFSEDLKDNKRFMKHLLISLSVASIGIFMEVLDWNFLSKFQCAFITFTPFLTILIIKGLTYLFHLVFKKEPFHTYKNDLLDGIWVKNNGDIRHKNYYIVYTILIFIIPLMLYSLILGLL